MVKVSSTKMLVLAVVGLMMMLVPDVTECAGGGGGGPAPAVDCSSLVLNMADCLSFVTNGSTEEKPEGTCCSGLKSVLKTGSQCVCEAFKNSAQLGVTLNITKALSLPAACHVSAPSVSSCGMSLGPGAAPVMSPVAVSPSSTVAAAAPTDIGGGSGSEVLAPAPSPIPGSGTSSSSAIAFVASSLLMAVVGVHVSLV